MSIEFSLFNTAVKVLIFQNNMNQINLFSFAQDTNFLTSLELAVRFGKTLIIQEMDGVEPVLYPLLRKDLVVQGKKTKSLKMLVQAL